ncbi:Uncharacterised protein [Vibrio cholerae]|nr:Uncharacterised protein [Vibrio cholerae]
MLLIQLTQKAILVPVICRFSVGYRRIIQAVLIA